jgi:hypothetical protein
MSKNITISNRINFGLALTIVFLLVFATNRVDKKHFETIQSTLTSLHNDRVLAQEYVYKMSGIIHQKRLILVDSASKGNKAALNQKFETLIDVFSDTELTKNESKTFSNLKRDFEKLKNSEISVSVNNTETNQEEIKLLNTLESDLDNLSFIQLSESKNLINLAQKSLDSNSLISNFEIGFLILIGIILQFTIFYRVKKSKKSIVNE